MVKETLKEELGVSMDGMFLNIAQHVIVKTTHTGTEAGTAVTASVTTYWVLETAPLAMSLLSGKIRAAAAGVGATTTLDILKVASGTAMSAGTALVTQVALNAITADTDYALTVTAAAQPIAAGSLLVAKVVTQGSETLKPITISLTFNKL